MLHSLEGFADGPPPHYERHKPETTLLYQIVEEHWPAFQAELGAQGKSELNSPVTKISQRIARHLEKQGLLARDDENSYLMMDGLDDCVMNELQGWDCYLPAINQKADEMGEARSVWLLSQVNIG